MGMSKRFYWLRLKTDFFDSKQIKYLRSQPDGDRMCIIYLRLMLLSLKDTVGVIPFDGILPSCAEEIAFELGEPLDVVQRTISMLGQLNLLGEILHGDLYLNAVKGLVGSETAAAERKRRSRKQNSEEQTASDSDTDIV